MHAPKAPSSTRRERPRGKSSSSMKSKPTTLSASFWFGLTSEGPTFSAARRTEGVESTTVQRPRSRERCTRPTRKPSSRLGGRLPAKTTADAYSIRCSRRRENSLASAGLTSGPYSLISVCVPAIGAMIAVEVRECPSISTRSKAIAASERPSLMASPLRPPANPAARTGTPRVRSERATLTPFPPASVTLSGALWRCPSVRLGTTSVRATAAFRVTVRIMTSTSPLLFCPKLPLSKYPADGIPHPLPQRGLRVPPPGHQRAPPDGPPVDLHDDLPEPRARPRGGGRVLPHGDLALHLGAGVHEALDALGRHEVDALLPPVGHVGPGVLRPFDDEVHAVVGGEGVVESPDRGPEA